MLKPLKCFTDDALYFFKENKEEFCKQMKEHPHNYSEWLEDFYKKEPMIKTKYQFDFAFKPFNKKSPNGEFDNAVALYELFEKNNIGPAIIYNEKFMSGFIFSFGYEYFMQAMGADVVSHVFGTLFFEEGPRRAMARNTVGRLYRYVEMTIEKDKEDRYELTRFIFENPALLRIKYNTNVDGDVTTKAIIKAFKIWSEETGGTPTINMVEQAKKDISFLANVSETDLMAEKDIIKYIRNSINKMEIKTSK